MKKDILCELDQIKQLATLAAKRVLTMKDAVLLTGLSKSHLYKLVMRKEVPYYKSSGGKITYFNKPELEEWLLQRRIKPTYEIDRDATKYVVTGKIGK